MIVDVQIYWHSILLLLSTWWYLPQRSVCSGSLRPPEARARRDETRWDEMRRDEMRWGEMRVSSWDAYEWYDTLEFYHDVYWAAVRQARRRSKTRASKEARRKRKVVGGHKQRKENILFIREDTGRHMLGRKFLETMQERFEIWGGLRLRKYKGRAKCRMDERAVQAWIADVTYSYQNRIVGWWSFFTLWEPRQNSKNHAASPRNSEVHSKLWRDIRCLTTGKLVHQ